MRKHINPWSALIAEMRSNSLEIATGPEIGSQNRDGNIFFKLYLFSFSS